jgi:ribosomal subunit interface protein
MEKKKKINLRLLEKNVELDERAADYILKKIEKLEKNVRTEADWEVEISRDKKSIFYAEFMLKTPRETYRSEETSGSLEKAVDAATDKISRQIKDNRTKLKDLKKRGARSIKKKMVIDQKARF